MKRNYINACWIEHFEIVDSKVAPRLLPDNRSLLYDSAYDSAYDSTYDSAYI